MARNAVLARMETICAEVMGMPEIFLPDEDAEDDNDVQSENLEFDEPDDESMDNFPSTAEEGDGEKASDRGESTGKDDEKASSGKIEQEKGVSVKVNCDDKKQQRYAKWISRALRAAVNPIVSRFNLNLKVNLDLNVANKGGASQKDSPKPSSVPAKSETQTKPSLHQQQRRADIARIKELERENRHLEKVFEKIVSAYTDIKGKLSVKNIELEEFQNKTVNEEAKVQQLTEEIKILRNNLEFKTSINNQLEEEKVQLRNTVKEKQRQLDILNKDYERKSSLAKELEVKLSNSLKDHLIAIDAEEKRFLRMLSEKETIIHSSEEHLQKMQSELQTLQDENAQLQQTTQQYQNRFNQLELKVVDLMHQNRELNNHMGRGFQPRDSTVMEQTSRSTGFTCPLCGTTFKNLGDLQIHTENCGT